MALADPKDEAAASSAQSHSSAITPTSIDEQHYAALHLSPIRELLFVLVICAAQLFTQASLAISIVPLKMLEDGLGISSDGQGSWT